MFEILQTLYWAAYGLVDLEHAELIEKHVITELIGKLMFGSYSFIAFIVLLNMLIAMMSNSYQIISVSTYKLSFSVCLKYCRPYIGLFLDWLTYLMLSYKGNMNLQNLLEN